MSTPARFLELPLPVRGALVGAAVLGGLGCVVGLVVGLRAYAPTAWAATFEVGIPACVLGGLVGLAVGSVWAAIDSHRG